MTDESAAGPKTDNQENRVERVASILEKHFGHCSQVLHDTMGTVEKRGSYTADNMDDLVRYLKLSAQLAGQIGRLETIQNRNSKAQ